MSTPAHVRIASVTIPASEAEASESWRPCLWVGYFIAEALWLDYEPSELPFDAVRFAALWRYHGEQANGGHAQYQVNTEGTAIEWQQAADLLRDMGLREHAMLLNEFIVFSIQNRELIEQRYADNDPTVYEMFYPFDYRFAELQRNGKSFTDSLRDWVLIQPWLVIDPSGSADMAWLRGSIPPRTALQ